MSRLSKILLALGGLLLPMSITVHNLGFRHEESKYAPEDIALFAHFYSSGAYIWDYISFALLVMGICSLVLSFVFWKRDNEKPKGFL
jgi:hypothetical protein